MADSSSGSNGLTSTGGSNGLALVGLNSGMDTAGTIKKIMKYDRKPLDRTNQQSQHSSNRVRNEKMSIRNNL